MTNETITSEELVEIFRRGKAQFDWCSDGEQFMVDHEFARSVDDDLREEYGIMPIPGGIIALTDVAEALLDDSDLSSETIDWCMEALGFKPQKTEVKRVRTEYVVLTHYGPLPDLNDVGAGGDFDETLDSILDEAPNNITCWDVGEKTDRFHVIGEVSASE